MLFRSIPVDMNTVLLSSTEVREALSKAGKTDSIPLSVMEYIEREGLYK